MIGVYRPIFSLPPCGGGVGWGVATSSDPAAAVMLSLFDSLPRIRPPTLTRPHKGGGDVGPSDDRRTTILNLSRRRRAASDPGSVTEPGASDHLHSGPGWESRSNGIPPWRIAGSPGSRGSCPAYPAASPR